MFDAKICCGSWAEADAITAQARAADFRVEIRADEIVDGKPHVFLKVWCAGNVDRIAEIEMILNSNNLGIIEDYGITEDPARVM